MNLIFLSALIALLFPDNKEPAFANFVTWKAIGFTITFVLSEFVCLRTKLIFVLSLLAVAMVLYTGVEIYSRNSPKAVSKHKIPIAIGAQSSTAGYGSVDKNCSDWKKNNFLQVHRYYFCDVHLLNIVSWKHPLKQKHAMFIVIQYNN